MQVWLWVGFVAFVLIFLAIDLFVVSRKAHVPSVKEALRWTAVCVTLALGFTPIIYLIYDRHLFGMGLSDDPQRVMTGARAAAEYLSGWMTEYALSLDNLFVIAALFGYFRVPPQSQPRVLFLGILGVLVLRGAMIALGVALIHRFDWIIYVFGAILLITAIKMLLAKDAEEDTKENFLVRALARALPVTKDYHDERFIVRVDGRLMATPLLLVLVAVESTDVVFAIDSIPAIFGITQEPFVIFTSNVFAVIGLRALYFALGAALREFRYLKLSMVFVLLYVAVKMLIKDLVHIHPITSLGIITGILFLGVMASLASVGMRPSGIAGDLADAAELTMRHARRLIILVIGVTIVVLGAALSLLPGPGGLPIVLVGMFILAAEFVWARLLLKRAKSTATYAAQEAQRVLTKRPRPWLIPLVFGATASAALALINFTQLPRAVIAGVAFGAVCAQGAWAYLTVQRLRKLETAGRFGALAHPPYLWPIPFVLGGTLAGFFGLWYETALDASTLAGVATPLLVGEIVWAAMAWQAARAHRLMSGAVRRRRAARQPAPEPQPTPASTPTPNPADEPSHTAR